MHRTARERGGRWCAFSRIAAPVRRMRIGNVLGAIRFAVVWLIAFALISQTTLATISTVANAGQSNGLPEICSSVDQQNPSNSHDRIVAGHLKCIACVIGHSLAPPSSSMVVLPALAYVGFSYALPFYVPAPSTAQHYSHSARGPPAAA
jgi:hypothetical protein